MNGLSFLLLGLLGPRIWRKDGPSLSLQDWLVQSSRFRAVRLIPLFTTDCELLVGKPLISLVPAQPLTHSRR